MHYELLLNKRQLDANQSKAQQQWGELTNDDLGIIEEKREELIAKIQERYEISNKKAEKQLMILAKNIDSSKFFTI